MKYDVLMLNDSIEELNKIKNSMERIKDTINQTISSIKSNWKSDASDQLVTNMNSSISSFLSYIDQLNKIIGYLQDTVKEVSVTEQKNTAIANSINK